MKEDRLAIALDQIDVTRKYTRMVLAHVPHERWYEIPAGCPSHVAWQVGHIAYAMTMHAWRTVGGQAVEAVLPARYVTDFGKGSAAVTDASRYPSPDELTAKYEEVIDRSLAVLATLDEAALAEPATHATGLVATKFDLLMYAARHEMLHVGQIGLIRRLLGLAPYR